MTNLVILTGKIFHLKAIGKNNDTAVFSLAVGKKVGEEWQDQYFNCICFKKVALALLAANPNKTLATVIGTLDNNEYVPQGSADGKKISKLQVICNKVLIDIGSGAAPKAPMDDDNFRF